MHTHSFRCCTLDHNGQHQCRLSKADRDQINHPELHPGVRWELRQYKDGLQWHKVILNPEIDLDKLFPTVGMKDRFQILPERSPGDYYSEAVIKQRTQVTVETTVEHVSKNDKQTLINLPWYLRLREQIKQNVTMSKEQREERDRDEQVTRQNTNFEARAIRAWEYLWHRRGLLDWGRHVHFICLEEHPILNFIESKYDVKCKRHSEVPLNVKTYLYHEYFSDKQIVSGIAHTPSDYKIFAHRFYRDFVGYCVSRHERESKLRVNTLMNTKVVLRQNSDDVWCVERNKNLIPIKLGGVPKQDVVVEPFYRFLPDSTCHLTMTDASNSRIRITIDEDYRILGIHYVDNGNAVGMVQVQRGHALLDMIKVCVSLSEVL